MSKIENAIVSYWTILNEVFVQGTKNFDDSQLLHSRNLLLSRGLRDKAEEFERIVYGMVIGRVFGGNGVNETKKQILIYFDSYSILDESYRIKEKQRVFKSYYTIAIKCSTITEDDLLKLNEIITGLGLDKNDFHCEFVKIDEILKSQLPNINVKKKYIDINSEHENSFGPNFFRNGIPINCKLRIKYQENKCDCVEIDVDVEQFDGDKYFLGYCHQIENIMVFDYEKVIYCLDKVTGEVADKNISLFFWNKHNNTGLLYLRSMKKSENDTLCSLLYIFKADNVLRKNKREMLHEAIRELADTDEFTDMDVDKFIGEIKLITVHSFKLAAGRLHKQHPHRFDLVHRYSQELIKITKKLHPAETESINFLDRKSKQKY